MSADVDSMFSVREVPWHREGIVVQEYPGTWAEARELAGLGWEPRVEGQYRLVGVNEDGTPHFEEVPDYKYVVHGGTNAILHSATSTYELISHEDMGAIVEAILETPEVRYETAGSLGGGKRVWALAQLGDLVELPGDPSPTRRYLALMNSHNETSSLRALGTGVRIVCANTWHAADVGAERSGTAYAFKHTKNWKLRVKEARAAVTAVHAHHDKYIERARALLAIRVTSAQVDEFINAFAVERTLMNTNVRRGDLEQYLAAKPYVATGMASTVASLRSIIASPTCAGLEPTAYQLVQAAGEFADHGRPAQTPETHFTRTMINIEPMKKVATQLVRAYA